MSRRLNMHSFLSNSRRLSILAFLVTTGYGGFCHIKILRSQWQTLRAYLMTLFLLFFFASLISLSLSFITRLKHFLITFRYHVSCVLVPSTCCDSQIKQKSLGNTSSRCYSIPGSCTEEEMKGKTCKEDLKIDEALFYPPTATISSVAITIASWRTYCDVLGMYIYDCCA